MSATATANGSSRRTKVADRFNWRPVSTRGRLEWIDKFLLTVDHEYQRTSVKESRVNAIAKDWDWRACLVLGVAKRPDGSYLVYDGQHRLFAARKRDDIQDLPCLVFDVADIKDEAAGFVLVNTIRGPMRSLERFKARIVSQDPIALDVAALIEGIGYGIGSGQVEFKLQCIQAIETVLVRDRETAETVLTLCAEIYSGKPIVGNLFKAMAYVHGMLKKVGDRITRPDIRRKLVAAGPEQLERDVSAAAIYHKKSGERVFADGIVKLINKNKSTNRIPSPVQ